MAKNLATWDPEDDAFWRAGGKRIATRNLWISIPCLLVGFAVWLYWGIITVQMINLKFPFSQAELFTLAAIAGLSGATLRIPSSFFIGIAGGRNTIFLTTALLIVPAAGTGLLLQDPNTPLWQFQIMALLSGFGGGNFASSMSNISFFYPKSVQGYSLGMNAGLGNFGVTTMQILVPLVMTVGIFGGSALVLANSSGTLIGKIPAGTETYIHNAGYVWIAILIPLVVAAWFGMNNITAEHVSPGLTSTPAAFGKILGMLAIGLITAAVGLWLLLPAKASGSGLELSKWIVLPLVIASTVFALRLIPGTIRRSLDQQYAMRWLHLFGQPGGRAKVYSGYRSGRQDPFHAIFLLLLLRLWGLNACVQGQGAERLVHHIHGRVAAVCLGRGSPVQRRVRPLEVVKADPITGQAPGGVAVGDLVEIDRLVFERAPQPLDEDVVHAPAPAIHRDPDAGRLQAPGEGEAGELAALVGVEYLRPAVSTQGLVERVCTEARVQRVRQPPGQDVPARPVHDRHEVKEATLHRDVGDIGAPDMVRPLDRQAPQQIWVNPVLGVRRAGPRRPPDRLKPHQAHQPCGPPAPDTHALAAQVKHHPAGAVKRVLQEQLVDPPHQRQRLDALPLRLVVERGARDRQQAALPAQAQRRVITHHHRAPLRPAHRPDPRDKKSRSTISSPILA